MENLFINLQELSHTISSMYYYKVISRILVAVIIGGIVGYEREFKNRPAGFRTHILVCVSACSLMLLSDLLFHKYYQDFGIVLDPQRLGAQVVSGVGFLGAGTIMHFGTSVRGLTTAASIWSVAALGLICGAGFFFLAFFALIAIELILIIFDRFSSKNPFKNKFHEFQISLINSPEIIGKVTMFFIKKNIEIVEINSVESTKETKKNIVDVKIVLNMQHSTYDFNHIITELQKQSGIISIHV